METYKPYKKQNIYSESEPDTICRLFAEEPGGPISASTRPVGVAVFTRAAYFAYI